MFWWETPGVSPMLLDVMPLISVASCSQFRPCSGKSSICRRSTLPATCDERVLMSGASPLTVRVSASAATLRLTGRLTLWPTSSSTCGNSVVANPDSSMCTLYRPGAILTSRYSPRASVTAEYVRPVARSVAVTFAPGNTPFDSSMTVPLSVAVLTCACAFGIMPNMTATRVNHTKQRRFIIPPLNALSVC